MEKSNHFKLVWEVAPEESGLILRQFLKEKEISRLALTEIKYQGGKIIVNGSETTVRHVLSKCDVVEVYFPVEKPSEQLVPEDIPLEIVYEDEYLLVVNKPAGINSIPSRLHPTGSLANGLMFYYQKIGLVAAPHIVTRLDKDTSGLVLVAKNGHVHHLLSGNQIERLVKRQYEAIVHGEIFGNGEVNAPIGRKDTSIIEREVRSDGKSALTLFERINYNKVCNYSHVRLKLMTGRTHQIRVHMSHLGHPLLGDNLYGGKLEQINRQALHCYEISFVHPITKCLMSFDVCLPCDMKKLL